MSEATAESLLAEAEALYKRSELDYRDARIQVAGTLHRFVIAYLVETNGLARLSAGKKAATARAEAMRIAAERLQTSVKHITWLLYIGAVRRLIVDIATEGNIGTLGLASIYQFFRFLRRIGIGPGKKRKKDVDVSLGETWVIKSEYVVSAPALFRKAVEESWSTFRVRAEVCSLYGGSTKSRFGRRGSLPAKTIAKIEDVALSMKYASVGDTTDVCLQFVLANEEPWMVAQKLIAELQRIPRKKHNHLYFEAGT